MRGIDRLFAILVPLFLVFVLMVTSVSAYQFNVSQEVKDKATRTTLRMGEEVNVGNLTLKYVRAEAVYTSILVTKNGESQYFSSDGSGVATQYIPLWTNNIAIHIEKIGAEGSEDLNYVTDDSEITVWVEDNPHLIIACVGEFIEEPKNIGLNTGNFYSKEKESVRHWFARSYNYPPEILFTYAFDIVHDAGSPEGVFTPGEFLLKLNIYEGNNYETPSQVIPFSGCGDTRFTYNNTRLLIQPYFFMENGNWDIAIREENRVCPRDMDRPITTAFRPDSLKIISLGLYDDVRNPLSNLSARNVERFGDSSVKIDFKVKEGDWETYIFSDCGWRQINNGPLIRLAGLYGKEVEFYITTGIEEFTLPAERYNPFWDRILEILGFY